MQELRKINTNYKKMDVLSNCMSEYFEKLWHMVKNQVMQTNHEDRQNLSTTRIYFL